MSSHGPGGAPASGVRLSYEPWFVHDSRDQSLLTELITGTIVIAMIVGSKVSIVGTWTWTAQASLAKWKRA